MVQAPIDSSEIVVTAARAPEAASETAASVIVIGKERIERLGEPLLPALLRLVPSTSVAVSGPAGALTEVRIRGAEAGHSLLFVDGVKVNDPAAGNIPRFELLNADLASRVEVVRGPQSALWGSEAVGGVIAVDGDPGVAPGYAAASEAGSFGFRRALLAGSATPGQARLAFGLGWQRATGIDSFDGHGDRDGYRNLAGRLRGAWAPSPALELGVAAMALAARSEFDGFDPATFRRSDTLDSSRNRLAAGRVWGRFGAPGSAWSGRVEASLLNSSNRNLLGESELNRTRGRRWTLGGQAEHRFAAAGAEHRLVAALDHETEALKARDVIYGGLSNQDRDRIHQAVTVEWRAEAGPVVGDVAVRHDRFNRFADATSLRLSALVKLGGGLSAAASYGEGIAQPTFFDLYGFFPGSFVGNPALRPETSRGVEASIRYRSSRLRGALTAYRQRLRGEIVDLFDPGTFLSTTANRDSVSRRSGVEAELDYQLGETLRLTANYAYLDASEPGFSPSARVREVRRPRHSGSVALDGTSGRLSYGASVAFTGARRDMDFDRFPAQAVRLGSYWLGGVRIAYAVSRRFELFARAANAFDVRYQDVLGYRTEGRSLHAGIRLADRR